MIRHLALVVLVAGISITGPAWSAPPAAVGVEVTYLANEGFLIAAGDTRVLIDALFGTGIKGYPVVPEEERQRLEGATGPFAGVDLVLATHFHRDHFDPRSVIRHLRSNPEARFLSTRQAVDRLRQMPDFEELAGRIEGHWPAEGERVRVEHRGVAVTIFNLHHGRGRSPPVQNLGFLVEIGGLRLLHVGDTEVTLDDIRPYALGRADVDVFFVPAWYYSYERWQPVVAEVDAAVRVVMHLAEPDAPASWFGPDGSRAKRLERILEQDPEAVVLRSMEIRLFP